MQQDPPSKKRKLPPSPKAHRTSKRAATEVADRRGLHVVVNSLIEKVERSAAESAKLRTEVASLRTEIESLRVEIFGIRPEQSKAVLAMVRAGTMLQTAGAAGDDNRVEDDGAPGVLSEA